MATFPHPAFTPSPPHALLVYLGGEGWDLGQAATC